MTDAKWIKRDDTPTSLFNPLKEDVISIMRDDDNRQLEYKIPSMEISTFPAYIGNRLKVDLKNAIKNVRGVDLSNPKEQDSEIEKEISVNET